MATRIDPNKGWAWVITRLVGQLTGMKIFLGEEKVLRIAAENDGIVSMSDIPDEFMATKVTNIIFGEGKFRTFPDLMEGFDLASPVMSVRKATLTYVQTPNASMIQGLEDAWIPAAKPEEPKPKLANPGDLERAVTEAKVKQGMFKALRGGAH